MTTPHHRLSPSAFGRSFELECDRQLKISLLTKEHTPEPWQTLKEQARLELKTRAATRVILQAGHQWEEEALGRPLVQARLVAPPPSTPGEPIARRRWSTNEAQEVQESLRVLREARPGQLLYQLKLAPPPTLYQTLGLDPAVIELRPNLPDLVQVLSEGDLDRERLGERPFMSWLSTPSDLTSGRVFRVIDLKRSAKVKVSHRVQVLYYALELAEVLRAEGIEGRVDLDLGGVWIGGQEEPTAVRLDAVRPFFEDRLASLPALLSAPAEEAKWRLQEQCEWCDLRPECAAQATREDHISRLQGVTARGLETLEGLGARRVADLNSLLLRPQIDDDLARCASLDKQTLNLRARVESHMRGAPVPLARLSQLIPVGEDLAVFLTAQSEPRDQRPWGLGLLAVDRTGRLNLPKEPLTVVAPSSAEVAPMLLGWFIALERCLATAGSDPQGSSVQLYCYSSLERRIILDALHSLRAEAELRQDQGVWDRCERLLHVIQGAELLSATSHPAVVNESPVISLLSALSGLYALPIDVAYSLPEVAQALSLGVSYPRSDSRHFPYGHQLRSDAIIEAWEGGPFDPSELLADLSARLMTYAALLDALRARRPEALIRKLPPFRLPETFTLRHPDLSRLAYFTQHELSLEAQSISSRRFDGFDSAERYGTLPVLQSVGNGRFMVVSLPVGGEGKLEVDGFAPWLLVEASAAGLSLAARINARGDQLPEGVEAVKIAQLIRAPHNPPGVEEPMVGDIVTLSNANGGQSNHRQAGLRVPVGRYFFLCLTQRDLSSSKVIDSLRKISDALPPSPADPSSLARGKTLLVSLLNGQAAPHNHLSYDPPIAHRLEADRLTARLTESQRAAWAQVASQRVSAIWGPPGTGKTHFLASYILSVAAAHIAEGRSLRIVVSAMTNAAIDNLMTKIASLSASLRVPPVMIRAGKWTVGRRPAIVELVDGRDKLGRLPTRGVQVVGATQWKLEAINQEIDLMVVDEASQLLISHASIGFSCLKASGRVVVAGDHEQLGPVLKGDYASDDPAQERLAGSILDLVRGASLSPHDPERAGVPMCQLLENFRMCERLTELSRVIYGPRYTCATPEVAARRLSYDASQVRLTRGQLTAVYDAVNLPEGARGVGVFADPSALIQACLSPDAPLTLVVLEGVHAARENPREAALVSALALSLREAVGAGRSDESFWREDLFVIGPHHRQNDLTKGALKSARGWSFNPFVETVDKAQGQEAECVLISYGVSDEELAAAEGSFLYDRNRLNVSITRAQGKAVVFLSRPVLDGSAALLDDPGVLKCLGYMQGLERLCQDPARGRSQRFDLDAGASALVYSLR